MNINKAEHERRKEKVLLEAFKLFVDNSIEAISMQNIADAAGIGVASVFRYYATKTDLVIAVSAYMWNKSLSHVEENRPVDFIKNIDAIDRLEYTLDMFIDMYKNQKDLLKFNDNFNHYMMHEGVEEERLEIYSKTVNPILERLHWMYERGKEDKTLRSDIPEDELIRATAHTMMAACHHYAGGFIWGADEDRNHDYSPELYILKDMIMEYARGRKRE